MVQPSDASYRLLPTRQTWSLEQWCLQPLACTQASLGSSCADLPRMCQDHSCRLQNKGNREGAISLRKQAEKPHPVAKDIQPGSPRGHLVSQTHDQVSAVSQDGQAPSGTVSTLTLRPPICRGRPKLGTTWGRFQTLGGLCLSYTRPRHRPCQLHKGRKGSQVRPGRGDPNRPRGPVWASWSLSGRHGTPPPDGDKSSCAWSAVQCRASAWAAGCPRTLRV